MWTIWEERFEIFDDTYVCAKWFEITEPMRYVVLHNHHERTGVTILDEFGYYNFKEKLHNFIKNYDQEKISPYQRALARPVITFSVLKKLEETKAAAQ